MERARLAMESVKLGSSHGSFDLGAAGASPGMARLVGSARARMAAGGAGAARGASRTVRWVSHRVGYALFRALSTLNLVGAVVLGVGLQVLAYYDRGALNPDPAVCALFYAPALAAMALLREALRASGTARSGVAPERSHAVLLAYTLLAASAALAFAQPVVVRFASGISRASMLVSVAGSAFFFYALLISEVLFAAAVAIRAERYADGEGGDALIEDYGAI